MSARWRRLGAVDVGSHSIRYLVADVAEDDASGASPRWREIERGRIGARLGEGWREGEALAEAAVRRAVEAVRHVAERLAASGAERVEAVATGVAREAADGTEAVERLRRASGLPVRLITGDEEAALSFRGAIAGLLAEGIPADGALLVVDIGGGSTEGIAGRIGTRQGSGLSPGEDAEGRVGPHRFCIEGRRSVPLGAERLTEAFIRSDPPAEGGWDALLAHAGRVWDEAGIVAEDGAAAVVVGGTVTTIAAMDLRLTAYDRDRLHGYELTREAAGRWAQRLARASRSERRHIPGLPPERVDIIPAGAAVLWAIMEAAGLPSVRVGQWDILEGLIYP